MEKIELNIEQLLKNPTGAYSSFFTSRERVKTELNARFYALLRKQVNSRFEFKVFQKPLNGNFIFFIKVPSETFDDLYYDVLLEFEAVSKEHKKSTTILDYKIRVFSNSPDFVFTYAYVVNKNDFLCSIAKKKLSTEALTQEPKIKNPFEIYGFEKSCYYACKFIKEFNLYTKPKIKDNLFMYNELKLLSLIKTDREKLQQYKDKKEKKQKKKAKKATETKKTDIKYTTRDKHKSYGSSNNTSKPKAKKAVKSKKAKKKKV